MGCIRLTQYIALLRGINISGKNKISMPLLKAAFEAMGFLDVSTYINSGNVLFSSEGNDTGALSILCHNMIEAQFLLDIPVVVLSRDELRGALDNAPAWWDVPSEKTVIHQVIFPVPPLTVEAVYQAVGEAKPAYEQVGSYQNVIFWSAPRATLSRTRWYKIASSSVNDRVTIRNASTAKKLLALSG